MLMKDTKNKTSPEAIGLILVNHEAGFESRSSLWLQRLKVVEKTSLTFLRVG